MKKKISQTDLSIIIVSYNTKKLTQECLVSVDRSLRCSKINYELIVVDNHSTDGSVEILKKYLLKKSNTNQLICLPENLGFGRANNLAVKKAKGRYLLFLNSDTIILDRAIEKMFALYKDNENKINFLGPKLLNNDLSPQPSAAHFFRLPVVFAALFLKGDYWGLTRFSPSKLEKVDWVSGACLLTKKEYFEQLGGFDEKIFMYMEEVDLLYRARKLSWNTYFYPTAKVIHLGFASSGKKTVPILQVYRGLVFFYQKHYSKLSLFILRLLLRLKAMIALVVGKLRKDDYLVKTYERAWQIV
ncbi:MAG: glycosyltransferase family 2 protein [Patescibacteria group bacterium]|nr:glycosyltransferase family 2 protein [Patescibacteria group bacterium]